MSQQQTVLILGKGPSARYVDRSDPRVICALNGAVKFCGRCDWLFVNDVSALEEISESCVGITRNIVVPSELHQDRRGRRTMRFDQLPDWFVELPCLHIYQLHTAQKRRHDIPDFGRIWSVGETAVCWMLKQGHREFVTLGIDPVGGYHEEFQGGPQDLTKPANWYDQNWRRMEYRVHRLGGTISRLNPEQKESCDGTN